MASIIIAAFSAARVDIQEIVVEQRTVLIISEQSTDHLILSSCLQRAVPACFNLTSHEHLERPLEALMDPNIDAVIMAWAPAQDGGRQLWRVVSLPCSACFSLIGTNRPRFP